MRGAASHEASRVDDRFRLVRELGRGGMGAVYRAEDLERGTTVAVKIMLPQLSGSEDLARFAREAKILSSLNHPNIVQLYDYGELAGMPFIVMEYLHGQSLASWLERLAAPPSLDEVSPIFLQVLAALEAAHGLSVVHRDLKPANVFLAEGNEGEVVVKVLDFGLARIDSEPLARSLTRTGAISGTPQYMSPEQCRSLHVGPSTDIYALGCLLTELLQLAPPFDGPTRVDIMNRQLFMAPSPLQLPPGRHLPESVEKLRLALLRKDPDSRPPNIQAIRLAWQAVIADRDP